MRGLASEEMVIGGWVLVSLYAAITIFLVIRGARKTKTIDDYAVGSVVFSPVFVGLSLAASMMSAATFIINPGLIALYGLSGVLSLAVVLPLAAFVSLIFITKGFRKYGKVVKATTMAQWIGLRYKSPRFSLFFAFLSLLLLTFIVLIAVGLTKVVAWTLNVDQLYVLVGVVVFTFGYMMFGGANSMVYTNTVQALLMVVVSFILLGSGYEHFSGGVHGFLASLSAIDPNLVSATNSESPLFRDFFEIIICQIIVGMAIVCQPHIMNKSLFLKSDKDVNKFLTVAIVVETLFFLVIFVGIYARLAFPSLTIEGAALRSDDVVAAYVVSEFPVYVAIVVIMGLISAGISTLEGLIQALSTTVTSDLLVPLFGKMLPDDVSRRDRALVNVNRAVIALLGVAAAFVSYDQIINPSLSVAIFAQNGVYAFFAAAFVPVVFGTFLKKVPLAAPAIASVTAVATHFTIYYGRLTPYMQSPVRNPGVAAALAILASLGVFAVVYFALKGREPKNNKDLAHNTPQGVHASGEPL